MHWHFSVYLHMNFHQIDAFIFARKRSSVLCSWCFSACIRVRINQLYAFGMFLHACKCSSDICIWHLFAFLDANYHQILFCICTYELSLNMHLRLFFIFACKLKSAKFYAVNALLRHVSICQLCAFDMFPHASVRQIYIYAFDIYLHICMQVFVYYMHLTFLYELSSNTCIWYFSAYVV